MFKDKKNLLNNILFISIIFLIIVELVENFQSIGYFTQITKVLSVISMPIIMIILGIKYREDEESRRHIFGKGFVIYFVLQIINMLITAIATYENPGYFMFTPYYINWIFIAVPIYILIAEKLGDYDHLLFTTTVIALCLTIDGSINSDLICNLIMYLPFFILGWKYEKETEKIPKGKLISLLKILAIGCLIVGFWVIDAKDVMLKTVKTDQIEIEIMTLKLMLYAISAIVFSFILDITSKIKICNKEYKFNYHNVLLLGSIVINILLYSKFVSYINSTYSIILIVATGLLTTFILAYIPFDKIVSKFVNLLKESKEKRIKKREEKRAQKGKVEEKRYIFPPDSIFAKLMNSNLMIVILGAIMLLKLIMFYNHTVYSNSAMPQYEIWYNISFLLVFLIPLLLINNNRIRYVVLIIWDIVLSTILFADEVYYSYSSMVISVNQASNLKYLKEITDTGKTLLSLRHILYFIDIIGFLILVKITKFKNVKKGSKDRQFKNIIAILLILYMCVGNIASLCTFVYNAPYNNSYQVSEGTIFGYHITDLGNFINIKASLKYKTREALREAYNELIEYYDEHYETSYEGIAEGMNVIVLQLESIQEFVYGATINGEEITPNLNKFLDENIHITNMHSQSYTSTADSEFAVQMSMYPLENGLSFSKYYNADYDDLFSIMTANDYYTSYIHGNVGSFWNREKVYSNFDVDEVNFIDSFEDSSELIMGYLSDELLYKQTIEKIEEYENPFFVYMLSASSHTGFTLNGLSDEKKEEILTIDVGSYAGTAIGNYLESVNYADVQFGMFIDSLKEDGLYDNTVILVFGDHYGMRRDEDSMYDYFENELGIELNDVQKILNFTNVLAGIHIPGVSAGTIDKPVSKLDIKPTVISLTGVDAGDDMSLGVSIFSNKEYAATNEGTIITEDLYYDSQKWYYIETGEEVDMDDLDEELKAKLEEYVNNLDIELGISTAIPILYKIE